jgi:hypothetical protein
VFTDGYAQPPADRSAINGIRLVRYLRTGDQLVRAKEPQPCAFTDDTRETPVADAVFEGSGTSSTTTAARSMRGWSHATRHRTTGSWSG